MLEEAAPATGTLAPWFLLTISRRVSYLSALDRSSLLVLSLAILPEVLHHL